MKQNTPCPFCDYKDEDIIFVLFAFDNLTNWFEHNCYKCKMKFVFKAKDERDALRRWNKRIKENK